MGPHPRGEAEPRAFGLLVHVHTAVVWPRSALRRRRAEFQFPIRYPYLVLLPKSADSNSLQGTLTGHHFKDTNQKPTNRKNPKT